MKKYISLICALVLVGCNNSTAEKSQYNVVQMEEKPREVIKSNHPLIVTKITEDGYVVKHGDHYHFVKGSVPNDAILQLDEKYEDHYEFNLSDVVEETSGGYIVRHGDHYHFVPKGNNLVSQTNHHSHDEEHEEEYAFNPKDIIKETESGYIVQHGNHQHFIFKKDVPWYKPSIPEKLKPIESETISQSDFNLNFNEIEEYALKYNVAKDDIKIRDNVIFVKHHDHYHVYPSKLSNWTAFLQKYPNYKYASNDLETPDNTEDEKRFFDEITSYALKYNVKKEDIKIKNSVIYIQHGDHYHAYPSQYEDWDKFLVKYPDYKYEGKEKHHHEDEKEELNEQDLIQDEQVKMMLNFQLEKEEIDAPITKEDIKNLTTLELFGSELEDYRFLKFAENLEELDIGNNEHFTQSDLELLKNAKKLRVLKLRGNAAVHDITVLEDLKLEELWIDETGVGSLYQLKEFNHLKVLHAALLGAHEHEEGEEHDHSSQKHERHNELAKINSDVLSSMIHLEELDVSGSSLVDLNFTKRMQELKKLYVEGTYLSSIDGLNTAKLEVLKASGNEIASLQLVAKNLKELDLSHNHLNYIDVNTPVLTVLKLGGNDLKEIKLDLSKIEELQIQNNAITQLDFISNLKTLKSLQVQHNQIKDITAIQSLVNLESFDASYNEITTIEALIDLKKLQQVTLNHNHINDLKNVEALFKKELFNLAIDEQEFEMQAINNKMILPVSNLDYFNMKNEKIEQQELEINPQEETVIEFRHKNNKYNNSYGGKIKIRVQSN